MEKRVRGGKIGGGKEAVIGEGGFQKVEG